MGDFNNKLKNIELDKGSITEVQHITSGEFSLPDGYTFTGLTEFCRVAVNLKPADGSNINVEVWLPENNWNGRFLGTGNGGGAGRISYWGLADGLSQGFAAANTDMGTSPDANCAVDFPERWVDFGYRATHEMTVIAKKIIRQYYGRAAGYSYFRGDSTGGQQALMEAQRYPSDYNGIIAGVPANNRTLLHTYFLWILRALNEEQDSSLLPEQIALITKMMVSKRSEKEGGAPGDKFFTDPRSLDIDNALKDIPFNANQITALKKIYSGPADPLVPYQDALNYYERVIEAQQGIEPTKEFFRYFLVPGRCHGEDGSPGFNRLSRNEEGDSLLSAMVEWAEQGKAPEKLVATAYKDSCTTNEITAQRPVYPYPEFAEYIGGDVNLPCSYKAVEHPGGNILKPAKRYLV